jgi:calpain-15
MPQRIHKLFNTVEVSNNGKYSINLCVNGIWQEVIIDDSLPVYPGTNNLAFGKYLKENNQGILWVSLIEKAWAKLNGNYDRVILGSVDLGYIHLCGVPSVGYKHKLYFNE